MERGERIPAPIKWFAIEVCSAHVYNHSGKEETHTNFILAVDTIDALIKAHQKTRGWKKDARRRGGVIRIYPLNDAESDVLEGIIDEEIPDLTLDKVRKEGFLYGRREELDRSVAVMLKERLGEE